MCHPVGVFMSNRSAATRTMLANNNVGHYCAQQSPGREEDELLLPIIACERTLVLGSLLFWWMDSNIYIRFVDFNFDVFAFVLKSFTSWHRPVNNVRSVTSDMWRLRKTLDYLRQRQSFGV